MYLFQKDQAWQRALLSLANAHDRGKVSDNVIADQLAKLNYEAHQRVRDGTVGPRCVVVWRRRPDARRDISGGGHQFYTGVDRAPEPIAIPTIANGMDLRAIGGVLMPLFQRALDQARGSGAAIDICNEEMNRLVANLPSEPDEKLQ